MNRKDKQLLAIRLLSIAINEIVEGKPVTARNTVLIAGDAIDGIIDDIEKPPKEVD